MELTVPLGEHVPMAHQAADVLALRSHPRVNLWNDLGTGKMNTAAWLALEWYLSGMIDECVVVLPSMCAPDWVDTLTHLAWPEGLADVWDCRPPSAGAVAEALSSPVAAPPGRMRAMVTTYGGIRSALDGRRPGSSRYVVDERLLARVRGRRLLLIMDESQAGALPSSQQGIACRALAAASRAVISVTATPIGNPMQGRLWGMTKLTRPDVLARVEPFSMYGRRYDDVSTFEAFKSRYYTLHDPSRGRRFSPARAYPVAVNDALLKREVLEPMAPFTVRRSKAECLDLPPKVRLRRSCRLPARVRRVMDDLIEDDRAVLDGGGVVEVSNALEERLRTLELCGGFLAGRPVHDAKLALLRDVLASIRDSVGEAAPLLVWASRTRELIACALVAAGAAPSIALERAAACVGDGNVVLPGPYGDVVAECRAAGVGLIHGPTPTRERDAIQADWRAGRVRVVCAHPGVAGAGLNWQHVRHTVYFSQPLGAIARAQSEDRVHRRGLSHTAVYTDLVVEAGPDEAVRAAHASQRDAASALLAWMREARETHVGTPRVPA